ncbi:3-hydroxyacyl-ACP dehydratase Htd2 [Schizosaccharomyces japonicus yFS275]|uniref:3-hydroxyacyl-ACP dehydratase Htd2 n=1 Tax=Schizosaccharomyces japonicus (strain yFS275 / FY16936) TaxID=402676 RepID=B6JV98_SCHJY|nr:3-hydroxyacyl-ACP dehydratase Htd2 [Schizosaccharomyces japonicus yFS275]EEB05299.1 3-hydroxyacyl-ACP dehydratase Htd2 [Schizosaccharomyces japonicus yFS275]
MKRFVLKEFLTETPLQKLRATLSDVLSPYYSEQKELTEHPEPSEKLTLLPGEHLVYFNDARPEHELLGDGYDKDHAPFTESGTPIPFRHRLWLYGSIEHTAPLHLHQYARCHELVRTATDRVHVQRDIYSSNGQLCIRENRTLGYVQNDVNTRRFIRMRQQTADTQTFHLTPTPVLVWRYSALMFNAHRIHWDWRYTTQQESYPELLVPGPLLATFMLQYAQSLHPHKSASDFRNFTYRILSSAWVGKQIALNASMSNPQAVWIEDLETHALIARGSITFNS